MAVTPLPMLGACAHKRLEFDVSGQCLAGSNVIIAAMRARCASCGKMMTMLGPYAAEPSDHHASITDDRTMLLIPMVGSGDKPKFPAPIILTDNTSGNQTA